MKRFTFIIPAALLAGVVLLAMGVSKAGTTTLANPIELGTVSWHRDLDRGLALAKEKQQDVFLLFQEVPG